MTASDNHEWQRLNLRASVGSRPYIRISRDQISTGEMSLIIYVSKHERSVSMPKIEQTSAIGCQ